MLCTSVPKFTPIDAKNYNAPPTNIVRLNTNKRYPMCVLEIFTLCSDIEMRYERKGKPIYVA